MHWIQILTFLQQIVVTAECQYLNKIFSDVEDQTKLQPQSILRNYRAKMPKAQRNLFLCGRSDNTATTEHTQQNLGSDTNCWENPG